MESVRATLLHPRVDQWIVVTRVLPAVEGAVPCPAPTFYEGGSVVGAGDGGPALLFEPFDCVGSGEVEELVEADSRPPSSSTSYSLCHSTPPQCGQLSAGA